MKLTILITLFLILNFSQQQNISDLISQYQNGGGAAAFDPKSIKLPSMDPSSITQLRSYAEKRAKEQYDFNTILQKQLQSGNTEVQNELQNSPFFRNQVQNFNPSSLNQQNQSQLQNLLVQNQGQLNGQLSQFSQQQQFNSLQTQQPQQQQNQQNQLMNNPQIFNSLQGMLQQPQQQQQQGGQQNNLQPQQNVSQQEQNFEEQNQDDYNDLFNDSRRSQSNSDPIKLGDSDQLRDVSRKIKGDPTLAGYLDLLSSFEKNRFLTQSGKRIDSCEILQRISPIKQRKEQLQQCKGIHLHGIGNDEICFIFACKKQTRNIMFYRLCLNAIPLEQELLNLNNDGVDQRVFDKDTRPNRFMRDSEFSLENPIDCKESKTIIRDPSLIEIK